MQCSQDHNEIMEFVAKSVTITEQRQYNLLMDEDFQSAKY